MATTTTIDETNDTNMTDVAATDPDASVADQATRVDELRSDLEVADERSEAAREAYVAGTQAGLEAEELRALRKAWDGARAVRNAVETLVIVQDATPPATED